MVTGYEIKYDWHRHSISAKNFFLRKTNNLTDLFLIDNILFSHN